MLKFGKKKETKNDYLDPSRLQMFTSNENPFEIGVCFVLKYIGSHLIEEMNTGSGYADGTSTDAIKTILKMRGKAGKKNSTCKVNFVIRSTGLTSLNFETNEVMLYSSIDRISFCTADGTYAKIFAYVARNSDNETMECHAFSCPNSKTAFDVSLAVNQAFHVAKDEIEQKMLNSKDTKSIETSDKNCENIQKTTTLSSTTKTNTDPVVNKSNWVEFND